MFCFQSRTANIQLMIDTLNVNNLDGLNQVSQVLLGITQVPLGRDLHDKNKVKKYHVIFKGATISSEAAKTFDLAGRTAAGNLISVNEIKHMNIYC